jgi:hypothetical protein
MVDAVKRCRECSGTGPFGKSLQHRDGLMSSCKACVNAKQKRRNQRTCIGMNKQTYAWVLEQVKRNL